MAATSLLADVGTWREELGLLPVPLFGHSTPQPSYVLLNGNRGNFCLDIGLSQVGRTARNIAWSSDVGHYVSVTDQHVEVQRWDQSPALLERYTLPSVLQNLDSFHDYLVKSSRFEGASVVSHAIQVFRRLRAVLGGDFTGTQSLKAFLCLLASAADGADRASLKYKNWGLSAEALNVAGDIRLKDWQALLLDLTSERPLDKLKVDMRLLVRHASGRLFQEAHYEAVAFSDQLRFGGFLPSPIKIRDARSGVGVHFTPPALSRALVEEVIQLADLNQKSVAVLDPACGSGEFLREVIRQLSLRDYRGVITVIGWDVDEAACEMARFAIAAEASGEQAQVYSQIECRDSLDQSSPWPRSDIIVMNPPFASWTCLTSAAKSQVGDILSDLGRGRPDLAHAFLWKAVCSLESGGVLGSIMPASFLDSRFSHGLRVAISQSMEPILLARLGSHSLFPNALVSPALYVASKGGISRTPTALWSDHRIDSSMASLRALRKVRDHQDAAVFPVVAEGYSIYQAPELGKDGDSWVPRPVASRKLLQQVSHVPTVGDLFNVKMGALTGLNKSFLLDRQQWAVLPEVERRYFRPAVVNGSIQDGRLTDAKYVFYPYASEAIDSEHELREVVPQYYRDYLEPAQDKLRGRKSLRYPNKWWELSEHRNWQEERNPKLVTTYFGGSGSFSWDREGNFVVVHGFCWLLKGTVEGQARQELFTHNVGLAYVTILNSHLFSELLSATSDHVGGGQWNLSAQFVRKIPVPDLFDNRIDPSAIAQLAGIGMSIITGESVTQEAESLVAQVYGAEDWLRSL